MWWVFLVLLLVGCDAGADPRTAEVWVVDFQTYGDEVAQTMADLGLDQLMVEQATLDAVSNYYADLPIRFELGTAIGSSTKSSICIRHGSTHRFGRGVVNPDNTRAVHDYGEWNGTEHGAFVNRVAAVFAAQVAGEGYDHGTRVDMFAQLLGVVLAHEIGHGLGLEHSRRDWGPGDIMKPLTILDAHQFYYFSEQHRAELEANVIYPGD